MSPPVRGAALAFVCLLLTASGSHAGLTAYASKNAEFFSIDLDAMLANRIDAPPGYFDLAFGPDGTLYGMSRKTDALYRFIDPDAGTVEYLTDLPHTSTGQPLTVSPNGQYLYYISRVRIPSTHTRLFRYDLGTMAHEDLGTLSTEGNVEYMGFGPDGQLYATTATRDQLLTIDLGTLTGKDYGPLDYGLPFALEAGAGTRSMSFAPDGTLYALVDPTASTGSGDEPDIYLATIDISTGLATIDYSKRLSDGSGYFEIGPFAIAPEPSSFATLLFATLFLSTKVFGVPGACALSGLRGRAFPRA